MKSGFLPPVESLMHNDPFTHTRAVSGTNLQNMVRPCRFWTWVSVQDLFFRNKKQMDSTPGFKDGRYRPHFLKVNEQGSSGVTYVSRRLELVLVLSSIWMSALVSRQQSSSRASVTDRSPETTPEPVVAPSFTPLLPCLFEWTVF